jgi:peptidoglycan L-alanyl-D-glutamate endopeptidase CwlK
MPATLAATRAPAAETSLSVGMSGPNVQTLQASLRAAGFAPGAEDGNFGPATEAALLAFQQSQGLLPDGVVGARTAAALRLPGAPADQPAMPPFTVDIVSKMFPATPLPPIARNLPLVLAALEAAGLTWPPIVLAAIATIRAEAEGFEPIDEFISRYNTSPGGKPFDLYDNRRDLGNLGPPDGAAFKGRGFVQLTGRSNYQKFGEKLGVPLATTPELANEPDIAARLLAAFIAEDELPMKRALLAGRLATARSLVNGGTYGLSKFADAYAIGAKLLGIETAQVAA